MDQGEHYGEWSTQGGVVWFPGEAAGRTGVPGFHVRPEAVPGFRVNPRDSVRLPTEQQSSLARYASPSVIAALAQPPLEPRIGPEPGIDIEVASEPPRPPDWMERNLLGIQPELLMDPNLQPFYMDVPGRVVPYPRPWPFRRQER